MIYAFFYAIIPLGDTMSREEKKLAVLLSLTNMNLEEITATMLLVKGNKNGIELLTKYLEDTNEINSQVIMNKAIEIMEGEKE